MSSRITLTIRTANRHPQPNYLGRTVRSLLAGGVPIEVIHVVVTDPAIGWMEKEICEFPVNIHAPSARRSPNANALAQIDVLKIDPGDWILMLEDDIEVCADFLGSVERWLSRHARPDVHVYRFCAFGPGMRRRSPGVTVAPLREQRGSQAIALRADEALDCVRWAAQKGRRWRPPTAPFQDQPERGFDKLIGYWALDRWPESRVGYVSDPHFVRHIGKASGLYQCTVVNDGQFRAQAWGGA